MKAKNRRIAYMAASGAVVLGILGGVTIAANMQSNNLDLLLGRGKQHSSGNDFKPEYIQYSCASQDEALANAQYWTQKTAEEGMTLLKNDNNTLPFNKATDGVTVLGYNSWHNNMSGGEDPATTSGAISLANGIENLFEGKFNTASKKLYSKASGDFADPATSLASLDATFAQYPHVVITLKRNSGEGNDQVRNAGSAEQNRSGLTITNAELKLIDFACKNANVQDVTIVVNAANAMELGFLQGNDDPNMNNGIYTDPHNTSKQYDFSKVKAAIWAGCCGSQGGTALARILAGEVNPSGHLVDTYVRDLTKDPTYQNFGSYRYENDAEELKSYQDETFFVEYEEGIYVGYRYYETAAYEASKGNYAGFDYANEVVYPFGYGLSYTTFSQEFTESTYDSVAQEFTFKVKITNKGNVKGKGVAQIYVNVPYYKESGLEKAHVQLVGFGKTQELAKDASEVLTIKVPRDYFTTYDYKKEKAYVLEKGDYTFYLSDNAHSWASIDGKTTAEKAKLTYVHNEPKTLVFTDKKDGKRLSDLSEAVNKEDDELNYMFKDYTEAAHGDGYAINFTRANFKASFPKEPEGDDFEITDKRALKAIAKYDVWAEENNPIKEKPTINTDATSYTLSAMRGVDFDDPQWDDYMNQFSLDSMAKMVTNGGWNELADTENGVPVSYDADSPYGYYAGSLSIKNVNKWYCGDPMVAATFNVELAKKVGDAFGEEAHANNLAGGTLITGIYGYGLNMHRSAFGGRNYEYYAEDGILAGKMASAEASGASEKGLIVFMKHYCLNDQETNRQKNGYCAWVNEQAFREVYLKGWELYMKESKMTVRYLKKDGEVLTTEYATKEMSAATGIMTCYNRIGATWGGASVSIQGILQQEFGFTGTALTDAGGEKNTYMTSDFMIRRGGHLTLCNNGSDGLYDKKSATAQYYIKDAAKHILFNKANSNCVQGLNPGASIWYDMSPWKIGVIVTWVVVGLLAAADVAYIVLVAINKVPVKERPEPKEEY